MERKGAGTRKNHILFKNVLTQARESLRDQDDDEHRELDSVLEALRALDQEAAPFCSIKKPATSLEEAMKFDDPPASTRSTTARQAQPSRRPGGKFAFPPLPPNSIAMDPATFTQNPFAIVTFIVAPALLTNASCVLVLSTTNRMLRTRDIMKEHHARFEAGGLTVEQAARLLHLVERVEKQGVCFLQGMRSIYVALGAFAAATLVTLFGAVLFHLQSQPWFTVVVGLGLALGALGVCSIITGCVSLFRATHLSLLSIHEEAALVRISYEEIVASQNPSKAS